MLHYTSPHQNIALKHQTHLTTDPVGSKYKVNVHNTKLDKCFYNH